MKNLKVNSSIFYLLCGFYLLCACVPLLFSFSCRGNTSGQKKSSGVLVDASLAKYQGDLLDLAFSTATKIPVNPHIKDRSKAQEAVVMACLELDQPIRAGGYAKQIKNWRRGACYADLAFYCAQHGFTEKARHYLTLAEEESEKAEDWRRDRIRVKIARAYTLLGQNTQAEEFASNVVESETGKAADAKAIAGNKKSFDAQMEELDRLIAKGDFDILKNVHHACAQLFNQYYEDHEKRDQAEQKIKTTWNKLPIIVRLQSLMELAEFALDHGDQAKALELVDEIQQPLDDCQWPLEHYLALIGKTERLRGLAGDQDGARKILGSALERYDADGETIVNIFRAEALVPLAEAYQAMGDAESAQTVYAKAIEAGMINPNSRPRAEDLSATCVSMAANAFEPSEELRTRIHQISSEELGNPW